MDTTERKKHWENIFTTKDTKKVSWYEPVPQTSINLLNELEIPKNAKIIEIGSGDSYLADTLLAKGFSNITLLDISAAALNRIKQRLQNSLEEIRFIEQDILDFSSNVKFEVWHDRAVFHFIRSENDKKRYVENATKYINKSGFLIIQTFSENGPNECSGLQIEKYSAKNLTALFNKNFNVIKCFTKNHTTPSGSIQNFQVCVFQKK